MCIWSTSDGTVVGNNVRRECEQKRRRACNGYDSVEETVMWESALPIP